MFRQQRRLLLAVLTSLAVLSANLCAGESQASGSEVRVVEQADGTYTLLRNGEPYQVRIELPPDSANKASAFPGLAWPPYPAPFTW